MSIGIPELLILMVVFLAVVGTVFWIKMIIDCATREKGPDRLIWIIIIVFTHFIGAAIYYFVQRPKSAGARRIS
jgi:membrane-associated phospholipid phosphatase